MRVAVVVLVGLVAFAGPAAGVGPEVTPGPGAFLVEGSNSGDFELQQADAVATGVTHEYVPVCGLQGLALCHTNSGCGETGTLHTIYVVQPEGGRDEVGTVCLGDTPEAVELPEITSAIVLRALRRIELPVPVLTVQPPGGKTLVNLETILSTEAAGFTRTVRLLGRQVEVRLEPQQFAWAHGDGTTQQSDWPGRGYRRGVAMTEYLTHTYRKADVTVRPRVAVRYGAQFRVGNGAWQRVEGTVTVEGEPVGLRVVEATPMLVSAR